MQVLVQGFVEQPVQTSGVQQARWRL